MKISAARLKQIINEELFYREFHRKTGELTEDKVGDKISKLKDEGKPQKQAVAIALDMEERGDLEEGDESLGAFLQGLEGEKMRRAHVKSIPPEKRSIAGTQNLDRIDSETGASEEGFFGDKVDHDDVGTTTMEFTPAQFKKFMGKKRS